MALTQARAQTKCLVLLSVTYCSQRIHALSWLVSKPWTLSWNWIFRGRKSFLQKMSLRMKFYLNFIQNV